MSIETVKLFRPVGPEELKLLEEAGFKKFPPRLPEQPIFYPVTNEEYATQIAKEWNVPAYGSGHVTRFHVNSNFMRKYPVQNVGGKIHDEYWIPAEELDMMNENIVGTIQVILSFDSNGRIEQ